MRRATASMRRRLWERDARLRRFTVLASPDVQEPVVVVTALANLINELREPLHAELLELGVAFEEPVRMVEVPDWSSGTPVGRDALSIWAARLEDGWDDLRAALDAAVSARRADLERRADSLLPQERRAAVAYQRELFKLRLRELDESRGDKGREKLRREFAREEAKLAQLTFDADHEREIAERVRRLRGILEGEEYRRFEDRRERLRARIERERDQLLEDVLPRRYALARCTVSPAAVALLVPAGASS
jgi:hypothetical protein